MLHSLLHDGKGANRQCAGLGEVLHDAGGPLPAPAAVDVDAFTAGRLLLVILCADLTTLCRAFLSAAEQLLWIQVMDFD